MSKKLKYYKRYCKDIENVENFSKALADNFVGWCCHHRKGELIPTKELKALKMYFNRPANELIFITLSEHSHSHNIGNKHRLGKSHTEESKRKNREANIGEKNGMYGKHHSIESRRKMSEAKKSVDAKKKMSEVATERNTGRHWYHNDKDNFFCYECPPGCEPGFLQKKAKVKGE